MIRKRGKKMNKLIQTSVCSIIYGDFRGKPNQELFRCPRELDNVDLRNYINANRCLLGWEVDIEEDLKVSENYLGYYRLYFNGHWYGRWMEDSDAIDRLACHGIDEIVKWLQLKFPSGCSFEMKEWLSKYPIWGYENRYLLKPFMSDHYKVMFDTTYGNGDYPIRIYLYE